jgi:phosphoenolpyruvate carboxylase
MERARDRAQLPERMRRDVRLLGDVLGEVIRDSDPKTGPDLLADVERLRHAVIEARDQERRAGDPAGDAIAALVASWPTWPRNTSASGCCGSATPVPSRSASRWPPP